MMKIPVYALAVLCAVTSSTVLSANERTIGDYCTEVRGRVAAKVTEALAGDQAEVVGTVTMAGDGRFFIQNGNDGLKVICRDRLPKTGERVRVAGKPSLEGGRVVCKAKSWTSLGAGEMSLPRAVTSSELVDGDVAGSVNWLRVAVEGRAMGLTENGFALTVDEVPVNVMISKLPGFLDDCAKTHPKVYVTGVAELMLDQSALAGEEGYVIGVKIDVDRPEDIELKPDLAYLAARRDRNFVIAVWTLVSLLAVGLLVFLAVIYRQRRGMFRTRTIMAERKRMADDIHDTIEQHLVGAGMLLKLNRIKEAQDVLVRAKREIRDIVWGLKNDDMMRLTPAEMLRKLAHEENTKGIYRVDTRLAGLPEKMDAAAMRDLSLIVRETIGNAVKHGGAKRIAISSDPIENGGWQMRISNDGKPFDPETAPGAKEGHFGLEGMKQRARRVGASFAIERRRKGMVVTLRKTVAIILASFAIGAYAETLDLNRWEFRREGGAWMTVTVPHDWAIAGPFDKQYDKQTVAIEQNGERVAAEKTGRTGALPWIGRGEYRTRVTIPDGAEYAALVFDAAMSEPEVFCDGVKVGEWKNGYNAFEVELPPVAGQHIIEVRLNNRPRSSRWYPGAGLIRPVKLVWGGRDGIRNWGVASWCPDLKTVRVTTECRGSVKRVVNRILDGNTEIAVSERGELHGDFEPWSPENPKLYTLVTEAYGEDGRLCDRHSERIGVRTLHYGDGKFLLNGKARKFRGVCMHHDLGPLGAAFDRDAFRRQMTLLKEMGCDSLRTAHNMPGEGQLEICDELGIMVMAESFDSWADPKCENGYNLFFDGWWRRDLENLVRKCCNHASVVMWSIGNEITEQRLQSAVSTSRAMQAWCHRFDPDPNRCVTQGLSWMPHAIQSGVNSVMEIPGVTYRLKYYGDMLKATDTGIVLGAETASTVSSRGEYCFPVTVGDQCRHDNLQCSSYDVEYCPWSNLPDDDFAIQDDSPWTIGQFVWTGFDYLGEPYPYDTAWPSRSAYFGIFDLAGIPKDRYWLYRSQWNHSSHTLHLLPHWTFPGREGQVTPVYCYTDFNEAELFLNGKSLGRRRKDSKSRLDRYRLRWNDVVYAPGELKVVAYDARGKAAMSETVRTAGEVTGVQLAKRRFGRLLFVTATLVDANGTLVPNDDRELQFSAIGDLRFKATCNGDATSLKPFVSSVVNTYHGQAVAIFEGSGDDVACEITGARSFGQLATGERASLYTLKGADGLTLEFTDFGGRLVRCLAPDASGKFADVTLGWNTVGEYERNGFSMGTLIGRFGNRIRDGKFTLDGREYQLPINETNPVPRHCNLHGGPQGWDSRVWSAEPFVEQNGKVPVLRLRLTSPDGDMGFPGEVKCCVTYRVLPGNVWTIDYEATTDKPTILNLTHHSYWNLAGEASGDVLGQELQIFADRYSRTDAGLIPLSNDSVAGTGFDFTKLRSIGAMADWMAKCAAIRCTNNWYDHNFVLNGKPGELKLAAKMRDPKSGRTLEVWTTEPCLQLYGAQNMDGTLNAKSKGAKYPKYAGIALETQHAPDSPNHPDWPSVTLRPGETFRSHTEYRFGL